MGDIHNLQILISQSPIANRIHSGAQYGAANGAEIMNVVEQKETRQKLKKVRGLDKAEQTEKENARKRRLKKKAEDQLIDLWG